MLTGDKGYEEKQSRKWWEGNVGEEGGYNSKYHGPMDVPYEQRLEGR